VNKVGPDYLEQLRQDIPLGRTAMTKEIAEVALFLAGDRSSFVTGVNIVADGGRTLV
jgi:NAD(P)-dependent dehydrogenase (short-subunit alcohol dehydrogenase family)